ncbi:MAG: GNAT family N-acetyltransferase [Paracoccus sp. (in: a-proteobacteria)]|uniref:GNAT family N-acetyltransferase n=1 Tax=Paracoccus sp. TaxID=267 RepID=UPI0026DEF4E2|nr:GNAT family N-acetyltransferase [Paracoccus sp. (in: a-proteobacteria)]MDO5630338.1 GNAT family N-acetyltransferase [Paracoccus sp. (in: a-proteobacteria)]
MDQKDDENGGYLVLPSSAEVTHGHDLRLRGLVAEDQAQHAAHLKRLSSQDRYSRFQGAVSDETIDAYSSRLDWDTVLIFGVFVDGTLRAVGELLGTPGDRDAEIAVSVETEYQHIGLGKQLVLAMVLAARAIGVERIVISFLYDNSGMRGLAQDIGAEMESMEGVTISVKTLPAQH